MDSLTLCFISCCCCLYTIEWFPGFPEWTKWLNEWNEMKWTKWKHIQKQPQSFWERWCHPCRRKHKAVCQSVPIHQQYILEWRGHLYRGSKPNHIFQICGQPIHGTFLLVKFLFVFVVFSATSSSNGIIDRCWPSLVFCLFVVFCSALSSNRHSQQHQWLG